MRDNKGRFCRKMHKKELTKLVGNYEIIKHDVKNSEDITAMVVDNVYSDGYSDYIDKISVNTVNRYFGCFKRNKRKILDEYHPGGTIFTRNIVHIVVVP